EFSGFFSGFQQTDVGDEFKPSLGHPRFSKTNFVKDKLTDKKVVVFALCVPPVFRELLAGGLQEVASGQRDNLARNGAFDVDAHVSDSNYLRPRHLKQQVIRHGRLAAGPWWGRRRRWFRSRGSSRRCRI